MKIKQGISIEEVPSIVDWAFNFFTHVITKNYFSIVVEKETNWNISAKLVDDNGNIMGLYLLGDKQLNSLINITEYNDLKGVEGVLLAVDTSIRGKGWGNKLKDYPKTLGYDYIWGQQLKSLDNLNDWLKRRELVYSDEDIYITLEKFIK